MSMQTRLLTFSRRDDLQTAHAATGDWRPPLLGNHSPTLSNTV